jgi:GntR family transcriptional regulator, transcriptional repressor for pyruvate dehydrogenase complex
MSPKAAAAKIIPINRTSLSDQIAGQLMDLISDGHLAPGQRLPSERDLSKEFGVGRTSLREGLRSLVAMGILEARVGEGTFVRREGGKLLESALERGLLFDGKRLEDLIETRLMLETQTAFLAATRATEADWEEMEAVVARMEAALEKPDVYLEVDLHFHLLVARATQNSVLHHLIGTIRTYLHEWIRGSLEAGGSAAEAGRAGQSLQQHQGILGALWDRDAEKSQQLMREHILSSSRDLRAGLGHR